MQRAMMIIYMAVRLCDAYVKKVQNNYSMITTGFVEQEGEDYA